MDERAWYEIYFDERYLRQYEPALTAELSERQVDQIIDLLGLEPGARILDLACGHGRHAIRLAARGYEVTGLDLSEVFLDRAQLDANTAEVDVRWVRADMREIPFEDEFDAVINIFTAFGYLEGDAEDQKVIEAIGRALAPGGRFLLETIHRDALIRRYQSNMFERQEEDDRFILHDHEMDLARGILADRVTVVEAGRALDERTTEVRLYTVPEYRRMLEAAGLELEQATNGLLGEALTLDSWRLGIVARKPG